MQILNYRRLCVLVLWCGLVASLGLATASELSAKGSPGGDDWPQWMGPQRDNVWRETGLLEKFPAGGPKVVWRSPVKIGYAGPAVAQGKVFVMDFTSPGNVQVDNFARKEFPGTERIVCLDEATGKVLWEHAYEVVYSVSYPSGPRCTPIVDGALLYTLGGEGNLNCLEVTSGKVVWSKELKKEYQTKSALWGYAAHPLIDGDKLITLAGGEGSHIVALDKRTGRELWRALSSKEQGYAPPTIIEAGGKRQLITLRPDAVTALDPETGKEYWSVPYQATNGSIIMAPLMVDGHLYAAGYSQKSLLLKLNPNEPGVNEVWRDKVREAIAPVNVQPIAEGNVVYGIDQGGKLAALELPSGERLWDSSAYMGAARLGGSETAFIIRQGERYWLFNEAGDLVIARLTPSGYEELDRAHVIEPTNNAFGRKVVWSMPAFANRRIYLRNDEEIICLDVAK
ncbi:MAG: PQQ-like beta-propeller repeat protein [Blastopirellula sp.]|nr:PQQ-like beta-propeller repeat protein [Blastopirellula sp.]